MSPNRNPRPQESDIVERASQAREDANRLVRDIEAVVGENPPEHLRRELYAAWKLRLNIEREADLALIEEVLDHHGKAAHHCLGAELRAVALQSSYHALRDRLSGENQDD